MTMNGTRMETINNMLQPEGMQIEMKEFFKNNTTKMGLVIKVQDSAISRIIYPDGSFWLQTDEQIVEEIRSICENYSLSVQNFNSLHKEEILAKVKQENFLGDEREKEIRTKREAFSLWGLIILGCTIMILKLVKGQSPVDIISLLAGTSGLAFVYEGIKLKKKFSLFFGGILLVFSIYYFYKFCVGLF